MPELQATEEEKSKLESGLTNGDEPMDQDLSDVPTKCISMTESIEIKWVLSLRFGNTNFKHLNYNLHCFQGEISEYTIVSLHF